MSVSNPVDFGCIGKCDNLNFSFIFPAAEYAVYHLVEPKLKRVLTFTAGNFILPFDVFPEIGSFVFYFENENGQRMTSFGSDGFKVRILDLKNYTGFCPCDLPPPV
jgi:hypothetical protein